MKEELNLKLTSYLRRMGLSHVSKQVLVFILAACLILVGICVWKFWPSGSSEDSADFEISQQTPSEESETAAVVTPSVIAVDVEGEVKTPGMYELEDGSRVGDAIKMAGGLTKKASRGSVNLAEKLTDGQLVFVAAQGDAKAEAGRGEGSATGGVGQDLQGSAVQGSATQGLININTASAQELQALSGIGESISQRIVEYREANGKFGAVDDLTKVSGIGESRLASIRDKICV